MRLTMSPAGPQKVLQLEMGCVLYFRITRYGGVHQKLCLLGTIVRPKLGFSSFRFGFITQATSPLLTPKATRQDRDSAAKL